MHVIIHAFRGVTLLACGLLALGSFTPATAQYPGTNTSSQISRTGRAATTRLSRLPEAPISPPEPDDVIPNVDTLETAWELALQADNSALSADQSRRAAQSELSAAQAERLPTIDLDAAYTLRSDERAFVQPWDGRRIATQQREDAAFRSVVGLPLYTSGRTPNLVRAAEHDLLAADLSAQSTYLDLKLQVTSDYIRVLRSQRAVVSAQANLETAKSFLEDTLSRHRNGTVERNELLAAELAVSKSKLGLERTQIQLENARAAYNLRTGRPPIARVRLAELEMSEIPGNVESLIDVALASRPEIAELEAQAQSFRHQACAIDAKRGLQIGLVGEFAFQENRNVAPEGIGALAVQASWNAYDGGRLGLRAKALRQRADSLNSLANDLKADIRLEFRELFGELRIAQGQVRVGEQAVESSEEAVRVAKRRYAHGTGGRADLADAETAHIETEWRLFDARYDVAWMIARLKRATGQW